LTLFTFFDSDHRRLHMECPHASNVRLISACPGTK